MNNITSDDYLLFESSEPLGHFPKPYQVMAQSFYSNIYHFFFWFLFDLLIWDLLLADIPENGLFTPNLDFFCATSSLVGGGGMGAIVVAIRRGSNRPNTLFLSTGSWSSRHILIISLFNVPMYGYVFSDFTRTALHWADLLLNIL